MKVFALNNSAEFGQLVASRLDISLSAHEEIEFADGEHKSRPLESVRDEDVFVVQSLYSDNESSVNDKLCRLLFFIATLKDASAARITAIVPYLCYARKDRRTNPQDPVTTRYIAQLFEAAGTDQIVTIDVHNIQAFQNAFHFPTEHLEAKEIFADFLSSQLVNEDVIIMSPDFGGIKRAEQFQQSIAKRLGKELPVVFMEKYRSGEEVWGNKIGGDVQNKTVIIIDDLVSTGGTLARSAMACKQEGAKKVLAAATHGLFTGDPDKTLGEKSLQQIIVTNTVPPFRLEQTQVKEKVTLLDVSPLFAEVIKRMHEGESMTELLED